ncbi:Phophatidylserine decarboxylase-domain-containing protein [Fimicolochytrium jonesii]|uniref:Phophatidylserine decarboxylase-domain-containing protein n=1 Tax=Fimicolochytrium jonesii TaxID=1396493 RepID=UPI0022FE3B6F|nr:Phophatidylserine decarboxylase-domain-containing protein [Fimicolochytrium jonesii]KAI8821657.1 Phophatidylserine decarboxylase-domain-containing protein [Fimicolochytrium jonesii]
MPLHQRNKDVPKEHKRNRPGDWMPTDHRIHREWLGSVVDHVDKNPKPLHPVIQEFKDLIDNNTRLYLLFSGMFEEIPKKQPYTMDPSGNHKQVRDYEHMLQVLNHILTVAPHWNDKSQKVGMVGTPIGAVLDWPMGTPSGYAAFLDPEVNKMLKKVLNEWGRYLTTEESAAVLGNDQFGWFSEHGKHDLEITANLGEENAAARKKFEDLFVCDPSAKYHGYKSWDDFFTRQFREGARPVASPDDDDVIANACESKPYNVSKNVQARDRFWNKGQQYSVLDMLAHDPLAEKFIGGTVYQAFLSALSYHRWHAPVSGTVKKAYVVDGTYYSEPLFEGVGDPNGDHHDIDIRQESISQGYLTATATRALIFIESDNPRIGLMAFLGIGMVEVSTCEITVKEGQKVKKGDQIGMFHFGGSTHCLMFRKGVELEGFPEIGKIEHNFPVRAEVCRVVKK